MNILPVNTFLGDLEILEVFEFYNFPMLFICGNSNKDIFLVECLEDEAEYTKWLYSHISNETALKLRRGFIDFRTSFLSPVNNFLYTIQINKSGLVKINFLQKNDLVDEILPIKGEKIDVPCNKKIIPYFNDSSIISHERDKGVFNLVFDVGDDTHSVSAGALGAAITGVQLLFDNLGCEKSELFGNRKTIPAIIKNQVELEVSDVIRSSFGIQFITKRTSDGPPITLVDEVTNELLAIFSSQTDSAALIDRLLGFNKGTLKSLKKLLDSALKMNGGLYFDYFSPKSKKKIHSFINYNDIKNTVNLVDSVDVSEYDIEIVGKLSGALSKSNIFEIIDEDGNLYKGKMSKLANHVISTAHLNSECKAKIFVTEKHSSVSDFVREIYFLKEILIIKNELSIQKPS